MHHRCWLLNCLFLPVLISPFFTLAKNHHDHDKHLFHFKSRPELRPPKWDIVVYNEDKITDGYWFVAAKPSQERTIGSGEGWWGPAIYSQDGELVWCGSNQFDTSNVMDFRVSKVRDELLLTMIDRDRRAGIIFDNNYELRDIVDLSSNNGGVNGHELNFVDDGKSALYLGNEKLDAPDVDKRAIGWDGGACYAAYITINELDVTNNFKRTMEWHAWDHIRLNESSVNHKPLKQRCRGWDFIHGNSVDKTEDGDYIFSARHCNTIYRISGKDGSIVWRLGGFQSDFDMGDVKFSRQHGIRWRGQNDTHQFVSMLDNAKGQDVEPPSHDFSRGILVAMDMKNKKASLAAHYDHPQGLMTGGYAPRRGNMQILPGGNVFMGWSERALQSEHSPDGELLFEARFSTDWIGSYRNWKFPYVGKPSASPDVYAITSFEDDEHNGDKRTRVYVSWNGDTEVKEWKLFGSAVADSEMELISTAPRSGFETTFEQELYLHTVQLRAFDKDGNAIGSSKKIKTEEHPSMPNEPDSNEDHDDHTRDGPPPKSSHHISVEPLVFGLLFVLGFCGAAIILLGWFGILPDAWTTRARGHFMKFKDVVRYKKLSAEEQDTEQSQSLVGRKDPTGDEEDLENGHLLPSSGGKKFPEREPLSPG